MGIRKDDLVDTVLSKISIDEFQPKTGESKDIVVVGFYLKEQYAAQDLYNFINGSALDMLDAETSPNPDLDGNYMLFLEIERNQDLVKNINKFIGDIENVTGKLKWRASTHLTDDYYPLNSDELAQYVITDPAQYVTRDEYEAQQQAAQEQSRIEEEQQLAESNNEAILEFLRDSNLLEAGFSDTGLLTMMAKEGLAQFEVIKFGDASSTLQEAGIDKSPLVELDYNTRIFNGMLGSLNAVKIDEYVVIYNNNTNKVLVGKPC